MNTFSFIGNLGADAEKKDFESGRVVCNFSVATTTGYKEKKETFWIRCAMWGNKNIAIADYLKKGTKVFITGELTQREFETKEGSKTSLDLNVNSIELLGDGKTATSVEQSDNEPSDDETESEDDNFDADHDNDDVLEDEENDDKE